MLSEKGDLIQHELELGTGAAIIVAKDFSGLRGSLRIWFADLDERHGPIATLRPYGLKGHKVDLRLGSFSGATIAQIGRASQEDVLLARALVASISPKVQLDLMGQKREDWKVSDGSFQISAIVRETDSSDEIGAITSTCRNVIVPLMAAMAELIGYDAVGPEENPDHVEMEGALSLGVIRRRERNPRNRLLCIRLHGEKCSSCGCMPSEIYGSAGSIIEVHHLQPLSTLDTPRPYDPRTDLLPLCPNCHRAVHSRRPVPFTVDELKDLMGRSS